MNLSMQHICVIRLQSLKNKNMGSLFNDKGFWRQAVRLIIPVALQNLLTSSFTLADTLLVSNLGTVALSSVGMIGQWAWLMNMILVGFCSGATVFISQFWGIKDLKKIRHISGISISLAVGVAMLFTVVSLAVPSLVVRMFNSDAQVIEAGVEYLKIVSFSYIAIALTNILAAILRAVENVKLPMYVSAFTTVLNIFLDYVMIFGKLGFSQMGIRGAALATSISAWLGVLFIIVISIIQKNILVTDVGELFRFSTDEIREYIKKATPVVINEGMWGIGTFVYNIIYGNMGYEYFSALTIVRSFENICFVLIIGICSAASVMIGKSIGMGKINRGLTDSKRFSIIVPVISVVISAFIVLFRGALVSIFNMGNSISPLALDTAGKLMLIYSVAFPLRMFSFVQIVAVFRSGGDTITGARFELFCLWCLSVPATLIAVYLLKVPFLVAFAVMYIFEDIPKVLFCIRFYLTKKWIKPVTKQGMEALEGLRGDIADE